jgi:hypothetical protein
MAEHSPAATAATALMTPSTSRQEESTTATTTPKASNATSSPRAKMHVGMNLPGFLSMCIYRFLPTVLSKNPFQLKRKKSQELGSQGAMSKDGRPYIFLNEVCAELEDLFGTESSFAGCFRFSSPEYSLFSVFSCGCHNILKRRQYLLRKNCP